MSETLIREYYACFNERRFQDAAKLFAENALLEHIPFGKQHRGKDGYVRFVQAWGGAFPDGRLVVERIDRRSDTMFDVHLLSTGTHRGLLDIGIFQFRAMGAKTELRLRELLEIRDGHIVASSVSFDLTDLINQVSIVDYDELTRRLQRIRELTDELTAARGDNDRRRDVAERLGPELDAARKALRPHYNR
jgi:predicted ester cyclase